MRKSMLAIVLLGLLNSRAAEISPALKSTTLIGKQADGSYVLPTSQVIHPEGQQIFMNGRPVDLALSPGGEWLAVLNQKNVLLFDPATGKQAGKLGLRTSSYTGIAFRPGTSQIWASEATRNGPDAILVAEIAAKSELKELRELNLPGHPVPAGIAFAPDGKTAFVALNRSNSVAVLDAASLKVLRTVAVGMAPFGLAFVGNPDRLFVSNRAGRRPGSEPDRAVSGGSEVLTDRVTGATVSGTVTVIDLKSFATREIPVGLAPSKLALSPDAQTLAVANAHSDSVTLIDTANLATTTLPVPAIPQGTLGSQPVEVRFSATGDRLYIACAGNNAVAVAVPTRGKWTLAGALPALAGRVGTGWFPSAIGVDRSGALWVVNIKGVGNTKNEEGTFNTRQFEGLLAKTPSPSAERIAAGTREVEAANSPRFEPAGGVQNLSALGIQHVFLLIKENRTYDQVFGDMAQGNGAPELVMYGREVTPNHHALAEQYVLLDNFYASGAISFDGHHWLAQAFVSDYVERSLAAPRGYAWNLCDPLVISPAGFFWQGGPKPLDLRIYGQFSNAAVFDPATQTIQDIDDDWHNWSKMWNLYKSGEWRSVLRSRCGVPALKPFVCERYPVGVVVTDQIRAEILTEELAGWEKRGQAPHLCIACLTSDHTMGTNPGAPRPRAMVADNDLALGRIVEAISKSRFWSSSLILVVEDDAQDGVDHVDGHRTVALAIGPHIRRGVVDSNNYTQLSMIKTIQEIFQIPARTSFLKSARSMNTVFTDQLDPRPYTHLANNIPLDSLNPPAGQLRGKVARAARQSAAMNWREVDDVPQATLNRILWWDSKGYETAYPSRRSKGL